MELKSIIYKLNRKQTEKSCENLQSFIVASVFELCMSRGISTSIKSGLDFAFKQDEIAIGKSIVKSVFDKVLPKLNEQSRNHFLEFLKNDCELSDFEVVS